MTTAAYESNADAAAIARRLGAAKRVLLTTHAKPDGDAVGSTLALARALRRRRIESTIWLGGPIDFSLRPFLADEAVRDPAKGLPAAGDDPDLVVIVDTGSWAQLDRMAEWIRERPERTVIIDHHRTGDPAMGAFRRIEPACASTTQVLAPVIEALESGATRDPSIAEALFIGLATDTGWFRFSNADAAVFRFASSLLESGVDKDRLYRQIEETARPERLKLIARGLASLEFLDGGRVALMVLTNDDFRTSGGAAEDLSGVVNAPMAVGTVEVSVLVSEAERGVVKASFRSKPPLRPGDAFVDVNAMARRFGGGGHVHAAGAKFREDVATALAQLRSALTSASG